MRLRIRKISLSGMMVVVGLVGLVAGGCSSSTPKPARTVLHVTTYDVGSDIPTSQLPAAKQLPDFHSGPYLGYEGVAMNFTMPPFNNFDARAAFCLAINRDQINRTVLDGADIPTWHLVPRGCRATTPTWTRRATCRRRTGRTSRYTGNGISAAVAGWQDHPAIACSKRAW